MSLSVLTSGGGGGGASARILVTGLHEGCTVTARKDGKNIPGVWTTIPSPTETGAFAIDGINAYGTWTVEATDGAVTTSADVLIDAAAEYEIALSLTKWLYNEGDECEDVTGGWSADGYTYSENTYGISGSGTKNADNLYLTAPATGSALFGTANAIDLTGYSALKGERMYPGTNLFNPWIGVIGNEKDIIGDNRLAETTNASAQNTREEFSVDVSTLTGAHYIVFACTSSSGKGYLYRLWLE